MVVERPRGCIQVNSCRKSIECCLQTKPFKTSCVYSSKGPSLSFWLQWRPLQRSLGNCLEDDNRAVAGRKSGSWISLGGKLVIRGDDWVSYVYMHKHFFYVKLWSSGCFSVTAASRALVNTLFVYPYHFPEDYEKLFVCSFKKKKNNS